jgi:small nuclear ribonucleoprotein F
MSSLVGHCVVVKTKWGQQYVGDLDSTDSFMNLLLSNCTLFSPGQMDEPATMGDVLIRCNIVLYVREIPHGAEPTVAP